MHTGRSTCPTAAKWKYSEYPSTGEQELCDLVNDPYELDNRAADPALASTLTVLQSSLDQYLPPP
jgi:hypothetical protein